MSNDCLSCGGCFTGTSCGSTKSTTKKSNDDKAHFKALLRAALSTASSSSTTDASDDAEHTNHIIPTIICDLSKNMFASQTVLYKAMDELSLADFLDLAQSLHNHQITGHHIAWAGEYCEGDVHRLRSILSCTSSGDNEDLRLLCQHCNDQAEMHEMFSQLPSGSVGRTLSKRE